MGVSSGGLGGSWGSIGVRWVQLRDGWGSHFKVFSSESAALPPKNSKVGQTRARNELCTLNVGGCHVFSPCYPILATQASVWVPKEIVQMRAHGGHVNAHSPGPHTRASRFVKWYTGTDSTESTYFGVAECNEHNAATSPPPMITVRAQECVRVERRGCRGCQIHFRQF